ncbi:MAG: alpha/beta hydrolase [Ktedonobacteraceae bacterium]|nr:alpha/beta hydrolase [Ktedonobacteraceae bacterium]
MKSTLVFIHGSGDNRHAWRLQIEHFGKERAIAIDLPGHGERVDSLPAEVTVQDYTRVVYEIVKDELKLERPVIVGHSLGGAIALMLALEYGNELSGLILVGTGARLRVHTTYLTEALESPEAAQQHLIEVCVIPEHVATLKEAILQDQGTPKAGILYRDLRACDKFDVMSRLHEISLPMLIICGSEDRLTPPKYSQFLLEKLTGVKQGATLQIIPGAGHYVMREQAEMVNRAIEEWMV